MAIILEANYSKKLGLPSYSSHQYAITVRTEVNDLSQVQEASTHLYHQLQQAVDRDIQQTGFLPGAQEQSAQPAASRFAANTSSAVTATPTVSHPPELKPRTVSNWGCSPKQKSLIEKLMQDYGISFNELEELAASRFQTALAGLNRMQASGLIDELISSRRPVRGRSRS